MNPEPRTYQDAATVGACMAALAISDAVAIIHGGPGCPTKSVQLLEHHGPMGANQRVVCTRVSEADLVLDPAAPVLQMMHFVARQGPPGLALVTSAAFVEAAGLDHERISPDVQAQFGIPCVYVQAPDTAGDIFDGYDMALASLVARFSGPQASEGQGGGRVNLAGYLFDRPLAEHTGNLDELRRTLAALGLSLNVTLLDGSPVSALGGLARAEACLTLPYGRRAGGALAARTGQTRLDLALPMGLGGTRKWVEAVAEAFGVQPRAQAFMAAEEARARSLLREAAPLLSGRRVALFADGAKLDGLLHLCRDLRLRPVLVGVLDGRRGALAGHDLTDVEVLDRPGHYSTADRLQQAAEDRELELVVGTTAEVRQALRFGLTGLEFGFPCEAYRPLFAAPYLGYAGVAAMGTRLVEAAVQGSAARERA